VNQGALDAALLLCLSAGAADLLALNLLVLPAARAPAPHQLSPEVAASASVREHLELVAVSPAPSAPAEAREPLAIVEFAQSSLRVDKRATGALSGALDGLRDAPEIVVVGHADASGPEQLNERLSERRAAAVARWLLDSGIAAARLRVEARGEREPRLQGNSRRVELFVGSAP
jgi:OmpA-OmpF porin, OOP family